MQDHSQKVAAVTGGASGIGNAIVRQLVETGASVAVLDVNADLLLDCKRDFGSGVHGVVGDVTDEDTVERFIRECVEKFGGLHLAFNAAGSGRSAALVSLAAEDWSFTVDLCLKGVFLSVKHEARHMLLLGHGAIVNISSVCAHMPVYGAAAYCAAKSGVEMLTKVAALELADRGIRVNAVLPGYTDTPGIRAASGLPDFHKSLTERIPMRRAATPEEIARAAVFLASDEARYIVGASLVVDGGWELRGSPDFRPFVEKSATKR